MAANDDVPSIGGLIFALHQKPSRRPFYAAAGLSAAWLLLSGLLAYVLIGAEWSRAETVYDLLSRPGTITAVAALAIPIALFWFLALLVWRAQELRLMSSAMTEVAVRLAEPDRMAEQSVASLGQSVRRQVSFMNDAIGRAIGRASELEAIVHNEVAALERSYSENEFRIRNLIDELASERAALTNNSDRVSDTIHGLGAKVAQDIADATRQATSALTDASRNIAQTIEERTGAIAAAAASAGNQVDTKLSERGNSLLSSLSVVTERIGSEVPAIIERMSAEQIRLTKIIEQATGNLTALENAVAGRTDKLDIVLSQRTQALSSTLAGHADHIEKTLITHTQALEAGLTNRLQSIDDTIIHGAQVLDQAVGQRTLALASAMEAHAHALSDSLARKSADLDNSLMRGIEAVRRSSDNITKQSVKTIEGLASQAELLKDVSENLLGQINTLTNRFENQGKSITKAAHALETSNLKIDSVLQARHSELSDLLERMNDRARNLEAATKDYTTSLDGSMSEAERRARGVTNDLTRITDTRSREAMAELERFKITTEAEADRMLNDLRSRLSGISEEISSQFSTFNNRFAETSEGARQKALQTADELETMQARLRDQMQSLPTTSRASAEAMRRALEDQLKALEQLTTLANRQVAQNDVALPERASLSSLTQAYSQRMNSAASGPTRSFNPSIAADIAREVQQGRREPVPASSSQDQATGPQPQQAHGLTPLPSSRTGWSLGDLLDRASRDEQQAQGRQPTTAVREQPLPPSNQERQAAQFPALSGRLQPGPLAPQPQAAQPRAQAASINVGQFADALDPVTAADLWTRFRSGQRGILSRGVYVPEGQTMFDDTVRRYQADASFRATVDRYLSDFERMLNDAEAKEPGGRISENYLISDTGRVYLLLAHASGRIA